MADGKERGGGVIGRAPETAIDAWHTASRSLLSAERLEFQPDAW